MNPLLTPARIGPIEIKNRIVMPPMTTRTSDAEGFVTDDSVAYYMARVRGGLGRRQQRGDAKGDNDECAALRQRHGEFRPLLVWAK